MSKQEVEYLDYDRDLVECNLCHRFMTFPEYERHYDDCLDIEYLVSIAKQKGELFTREDLEGCRKDVLERLLIKYNPQGDTNDRWSSNN